MSRQTPSERFLANTCPEPNTGCILWMGGTDGDGQYGRFWDGKRKVPAHRWSYENSIGRKVRANLDVHHKCGVTLCVNSGHLQPCLPVRNQFFKRRPYCPVHDCYKRWTGAQYRCQKCHNEYCDRWRARRGRKAA